MAVEDQGVKRIEIDCLEDRWRIIAYYQTRDDAIKSCIGAYLRKYFPSVQLVLRHHLEVTARELRDANEVLTAAL